MATTRTSTFEGHTLNLALMADVAVMMDMPALGEKIRSVVARAGGLHAGQVRITNIDPNTAYLLDQVWFRAHAIDEEMGCAEAEAERASEAYRMGRL